jgi:hypothetical protein
MYRNNVLLPSLYEHVKVVKRNKTATWQGEEMTIWEDIGEEITLEVR